LANVPYPISGEKLEEVRYQIYELIRVLFEEKIGGADLGDVFAIVGDVLTLVLAGSSGLTKSGNVLAIEPLSTGGMQVGATGLAIKILSTGGLETNASGLGIKLEDASLSLGASGIKITAPFTATTLLGTANQVTVTEAPAGTMTLSTPALVAADLALAAVDVTLAAVDVVNRNRSYFLSSFKG
jgi:hypothetical protein